MKKTRKKIITNVLCIAASVMMAAPVPSYASNAKKAKNSTVANVKKNTTKKSGKKVKASKKKTIKKKFVKSITITKGKTINLKLSGVKGKAKWFTSNKKVATVNNHGAVKGIKAGTAQITVKAGKKKYTCKVIVKNLTSKKSHKKSTVKTQKNVAKTQFKNTAPSVTASTNSVNSVSSADSANKANQEMPESLNDSNVNSNNVDETSNETLNDNKKKDFFTTINLNDSTKIVTKNDQSVDVGLSKKMKDGKQYIDLTGLSSKTIDTIHYGFKDISGTRPYDYVLIKFNGHVYKVHADEYIEEYNEDNYNTYSAVMIDEVIS